MAEFCNYCAESWGMPTPEIDVFAIYKNLNAGEYESVLCEGCGMVAVMKDETGALKVGHSDNNTTTKWSDYQPEAEDDQFTHVNKLIAQYYKNLPLEPTHQDWELWLDNLKEPMKSGFTKMGFENGKTALPFKRFYLESRDYVMRDYMKKNLSEEDLEYYLSLSKDLE